MSLEDFSGSPADFESKVKSASGLVVADFYGQTCPACKRLGQLLSNWKDEFPGVSFLKVDIAQSEELAKSFNVVSLPTVVFLKGAAKAIETIVGLNVSQIKQKIEELK